MAKGKFSNPRPFREEDRQIEKAYRQVTGQEPMPKWRSNPDLDATAPIPVPEILPSESQEMELPLSPEPEVPEIPEIPEAPTPQPRSFFPREAPVEDEWEEDLPAEGTWEDDSPTFLDKLMDYGAMAWELFSQNKRVALAGLCAIALILIILIVSVFFASTADPYDRTILNNVYVAGVNLGGMDKKEAVSAVEKAAGAIYSQEVMLVTLGEETLSLSPADTAPKLDAVSAVNAAYDYGRKGTNAEKEEAYQNSLTGTYIVPLSTHLKLNERRIQDTLEAFAAQSVSILTQTQYGLEGDQPELTADRFDEDALPQTLVITLGTPGVKYDLDLVFEQVLEAYSSLTFQVTAQPGETTGEPEPVDLEAIYEEFYQEPVDAALDKNEKDILPAVYGYGFDLEAAKKLLADAKPGDTVRIPMEFIPPEVLEVTADFLDVLGSYQTKYFQNNDRTNNLRLASKAINGLELLPGETFSFNSTLGKRTTVKGYLYAPSDEEDEETVVGGGITQVASTLYAAALMSDLDVTQRSPHAFPVSYIVGGLDADIQWDGKDLRIRNNTGSPIRLEASATGGSVTVRILGTDNRDHYNKLETRLQNTYVPDTEYKDFSYDNKEGYEDGEVLQESRNGYLYRSYRIRYDRDTNKQLTKDAVADSRYETVNEILARVEPKPTTEPPTEPTTAPTTKPTTEPTTKPTETTVPVTTTQETTQYVTETTEATTEATTTSSEDASSLSDNLDGGDGSGESSESA